MKLMIASDIHGSADCAEQMLKRYHAEQADKLLLLGDILYHGPRNDLPDGYDPKRVVAMLNEQKEHLLCVRGNCDAEVDQMMLQFPILADYAVLWLAGRMVFATHGHHHSADNPPPFEKGSILLHGHTHLMAIEEKPDYLYLNPGSVSLPKGGNPRSYMILEDDTISLKEIHGSLLQEYRLAE